MSWIDIEVPTFSIDKDSKEKLACYPQRTFYPLCDDPSTRCHQITRADLALPIPAWIVILTVKYASILALFSGSRSKWTYLLRIFVTLLKTTAPAKLTLLHCPLFESVGQSLSVVFHCRNFHFVYFSVHSPSFPPSYATHSSLNL